MKKEFKFNNFIEAMNFVNKVADVTNKQNHHPNININYNIVTIISITHDQNNSITDKDKKLMEEINKIHI